MLLGCPAKRCTLQPHQAPLDPWGPLGRDHRPRFTVAEAVAQEGEPAEVYCRQGPDWCQGQQPSQHIPTE